MNQEYEKRKAAILKCVDVNFKAPTDFMEPFHNSVFIKKQGNVEEYTTETGIMLLGGSAVKSSTSNTGRSNVVTPNIGIVVAVGPQVQEYIMPGLRVYFNQNLDLTFRVRGVEYIMAHQDDVYGAIPDNVYVSMDVKDERELTREEGIEREANYQKNRKTADENKKDELNEIQKKLKEKGINPKPYNA
nr:hypothetical protein [uncultured Flavobacterium sp.]